MSGQGSNAEEYDPHGPIGDANAGRGGAGDPRGAGGNEGNANRARDDGYGHESGDEDEDMGFTMKMDSQSLSAMPRSVSTTGGERSSRTAPTAIKPFNASSPASGSGPGSTLSSMAPNSKVAATLAPLTTLGSSNRPSLPPNPAIGGLLGKTEDSRFLAHLEASAMENYPDKPWSREGADLSDYFNYGFTEETWTQYRATQLGIRKENGSNERSASTSTQGRSQGSNHPGGRRDARDSDHGRGYNRSSAPRDDDQRRNGGRNEGGAVSGERNERHEGDDSRYSGDYDESRDRSYRGDDRRGGAGDNRDARGGRRDGGRDGDRDGRTSTRSGVAPRYDDRSGRRGNRSPDRDPRGEEDRKKPRR